MLQESLIYKCIYAFAAFLADSWRHSSCAAFFRRCGELLRAFVSGSYIAGLVSREGYISRTWGGSLLYRLSNGLAELPGRLLHPVYRKAERVLEQSLLFRLLLLFTQRLHVLTAVFLALALIIPADYYYNIYTMAAVAVLTLLYVIRAVVEGRSGLVPKLFPVFFVLFLVCVILAEIFSIMPKESLRFLVFYFTCFMLMFILAVSIRNRTEMSEAIGIILAGLALSGLYGIYQYIVGVPVNPAWVDTRAYEGDLRRVYSAFDNPNNFAEILVLFLPFSAAAFFNAKGWFRKLLFLAAAVPPFIALLLTLSRSGWIGFAVAVLIFTFFKEKRLIPVFILLGILVFPFLPQSIYIRIQSITNSDDSSTLTRVNIYKSVFPILKDYWVTGLGLGNETLVKVMHSYTVFTKGGTILPHSHNLYLQIWFETGIAGILSFLAFVGAAFKKTIKIVCTSGDKYMNNILIAGLSALSGILVTGLAEYVWFYPRVMLFFWGVAGIMFAAMSILIRDREKARRGA